MNSVAQTKRPAKSAGRVKPRLNKFARQLHRAWSDLHLPCAEARVVVAVSGGADSVALLLGLDELVKAEKLRIHLIVAHLDHQLRKGSHADAQWVKALAKRLGFVSVAKSLNVARKAAATRDNLEQTARRTRYSFLATVAVRNRAQIVLTAHTLDDQAETVLLNLIRGSGSDGLGGIEPMRPLKEGSMAALVRPLVSWARRSDTEGYCRLRGVEFLVDKMNSDQRFARVRVRHQLLPLMATINPKIVESLGRIADLAREDRAALEKQADQILRAAVADYDKTATFRRLRVQGLSVADPALRRRALRQWLKQCRGDLRRLERVHVLAVESLLFGARGSRVVELPGGAKIARKRDRLEYIG
jgi:tRNA(Ile)-lysidine synthase